MSLWGFGSSYSYHDAHNYECSCPRRVLAIRIPTMTLTIMSVRVPGGVLAVRIPTMTLTITSGRVPGGF